MKILTVLFSVLLLSGGCISLAESVSLPLEYVVYVIDTLNYSQDSFAAGDIITRLNGVNLRGSYKTVSKKMFQVSDSSKNFSGTVIRDGKEISVFEPDIVNENKSFAYDFIPVMPSGFAVTAVKNEILGLISKIELSYVKYEKQQTDKCLMILNELLETDTSGHIPLSEYIRAILQTAAVFNDGHLGVLISELIRIQKYDFVMNKRHFFPLSVKLSDNKIYFDYNGSRYKLHSMNGIKTQNLLSEIQKMIPHESKEYVECETEENFWFYYFTLFGSSREFILAAYDADDNYRRIKIPGVLFSQRIQNFDKNIYSFKITGDIGILTVNTFAFDYFSSFGYKNFLSHTFQEISEKKIQKLVIDIRENDGGSTEYAEILLGYLTNKPLSYWSDCILKCSELARKCGYVFEKDAKNGEIRKYEYSPNTQKSSAEILYTGDAVLLIGKKCFSTALDFAVAYKNAGRGKIAGGNTGGTSESTERGVSYQLPVSRLSFSIPAKYYISSGNNFNADKTFVPDIRCEFAEDNDKLFEQLEKLF